MCFYILESEGKLTNDSSGPRFIGLLGNVSLPLWPSLVMRLSSFLLFALLAVFFSGSMAEIGVDVSTAVSQSIFACMKSQKAVGFAV